MTIYGRSVCFDLQARDLQARDLQNFAISGLRKFQRICEGIPCVVYPPQNMQENYKDMVYDQTRCAERAGQLRFPEFQVFGRQKGD